MTVRYQNRDFEIKRYPASGDNSLHAASAADQHILRYLEESEESPSEPLVIHDRFGALTVPLHESHPFSVTHLKSQENSILENLESNSVPVSNVTLLDPLNLEMAGEVHGCTLAVLRVPKSLELFRFTLSGLSGILDSKGKAICAFMTRQFTAQILSIAEEYFETVEQSRAWKKSRLLLLSGPKPDETGVSLNSLSLEDGTILQQYSGVFSGGHIDYATAFLLENLKLNMPESDVPGWKGTRVLDLGCGNGVISHGVRQLASEAEIHLLDDSYLAMESAKLNIDSGPHTFHWAGSLEQCNAGSFDMVISNPPFHFEYEIDLSVPFRLFEECRRVLKPGGILLLVANRHLNYSTRLKKLFDSLETVVKNEKFEVLKAQVAPNSAGIAGTSEPGTD